MRYDYDPIPLNPPEPMEPAAMLERARAHLAMMQTRRSVRQFSDRPVDLAVVEACVQVAGSAPSGANHQPWHYACVGDREVKRQIREAAESEERAFYDGRAGEDWLEDLSGLGTDAHEPFLEVAPWLIVIFAERHGVDEAGEPRKNYHVNESVGIATGLLINALHQLGLATLTHTPSPMKFLGEILGRPSNEPAVMVLVVGHAAPDATVPRAATVKKPLKAISTFFEG